VVGVEDVTSFFHYEAAKSAQTNAVSGQGYATSVLLNPAASLSVNYIMVVAEILAGFREVCAIKSDKKNVTLVSTDNQQVSVKLDVGFLY